jgi:hypothetical protein
MKRDIRLPYPTLEANNVVKNITKRGKPPIQVVVGLIEQVIQQKQAFLNKTDTA